MFKPVTELHDQLATKKAELFGNRDNIDRELIEKLIDEAFQKADENVNVNNEWTLDKSVIPTIAFSIDHYISDDLTKELHEAGWTVSSSDNKTYIKSK